MEKGCETDERQFRSARAGRAPVCGAVASVVLAELVDELAAGATCRALSTADGDVRTTVPVSDRGTAFCVASAAACGVVPTAAGVPALA